VTEDAAGTGIDITVPHSARIWNYWLGGNDHYQVDRTAGDQFSGIYPGIVDIARADRAFLGRVVRCLAGEAGVRQFLDVGTGLPTADNTHEVAQRVAPDAKVVYVHNDPMVLAHARASGYGKKTRRPAVLPAARRRSPSGTSVSGSRSVISGRIRPAAASLVSSAWQSATAAGLSCS